MEPASAAAAPWTRQPGETSRAFQAFTTYRDLGPQRSYEKVRQKLGKTQGYIGQIETWASRNTWRTRAAAWDDEQDRVVRETRLQALRDGVTGMQERQVESARRDQEALDIISRKLLERLESGDLNLIGQLDQMPAEDLIKLAALAARARKIPVQIEWLARGVNPSALTSGDSGENETAEEQALDQLLERIRGQAPEEKA